jgi:hypothetical protein
VAPVRLEEWQRLNSTFQVITGYLLGVSVSDPATLGGVVILVLAVSVVASLLPAIRAARLDPDEDASGRVTSVGHPGYAVLRSDARTVAGTSTATNRSAGNKSRRRLDVGHVSKDLKIQHAAIPACRIASYRAR